MLRDVTYTWNLEIQLIEAESKTMVGAENWGKWGVVGQVYKLSYKLIVS